jgi:hypothetical protein
MKYANPVDDINLLSDFWRDSIVSYLTAILLAHKGWTGEFDPRNFGFKFGFHSDIEPEMLKKLAYEFNEGLYYTKDFWADHP